MDTYRVGLFGGFAIVRNGAVLPMPAESQRLVAFLSLHDVPLERSYVAGRLWPDCDEDRARANLRSSLWRLRRHADDLVEADSCLVRLGRRVDTDVRELQHLSDAVLHREHGLPTCDPAELDYRPFARDLLPGWYDEWVVVERERVRQLGLHCLEASAEVLSGAGMFCAAIQALLTAIALDPLRESPQRRLVAVHLAEGNRSEAVRQYRSFAELLDRELGLQPSPVMHEMLEEAGVATRDGAIDLVPVAGRSRPTR